MIFHLAARLFANYLAELNETWWRRQQWGGQVSWVMLGCTSYLSPKKAFILILISVSHSARKSEIPSLKIFVYFSAFNRTHGEVCRQLSWWQSLTPSTRRLSHRRSWLKRLTAQPVSKHSNGKLNVVGKGAWTTGVNAVTKVDSRTWLRVTTSGLTVVSVHWKSPCTGIFRRQKSDCYYQTTPEQETTSQMPYMG